jgi:hypothetical protein
MPYYPSQTFILPFTTIRRERRLPTGAFGDVAVHEDQRVEAQDVVLRGSLPGDYMILDALEPLGLKKPDQFTEEMLVAAPGQLIEKGAIIASNGKGRGAKVLRAPAEAIVARVDAGQVILQLNPEPLEVYAMCPGQITAVRGTHEVLLETTGALIQCAWGNGKNVFTAYRMEPEGGIDKILTDGLASENRGQAIVMNRPIQTPAVFSSAMLQDVSAIIAPSLHADLRDVALRSKIPVILTEGFGDHQMSELVYNLLRDNMGRPALIDAMEPQRWSSSRPEIIIPLSSGSTLPPPPETDQALVDGVLVRLIRAPYTGMTGRIRRVVDTPRMVDNGLRLPGAEVQLSNGRLVFVPLANLEMLGRSADA